MGRRTSHTLASAAVITCFVLAGCFDFNGPAEASGAGGGAVAMRFIDLPLTAQAGATLTVRVSVTGSAGQPVSAADVYFVESAGDATSGFVATNSDGIATAQWTLGGQPGTQQLEARIGIGIASVKGSVVVGAAAAAGLVALTPIDQVRQAESAVSLVLEPRDRFGNRSNAIVSFSLVEGGGSVTRTGDASATWKLGGAGAPQRVDARIESGALVTFRVTTISLALSVTSPASGDRFLVGEPIEFRAAASGYPDLVPDSIVWIANNSTTIGRGATLIVSSLPSGTHVIQARAHGVLATPLGVRVFPELGTLYRTAPSESEIARVQQDFEIVYVDGGGADESWAAYPSYAFNLQSTAPSRLAIIAKLDILRRQRFSVPPPFTGGLSVYDWMRTNVRRLNMRLSCDNNSGGGGAINFSRTISHWDARTVDCKVPLPNPFVASVENPLQLVVHEARHSEPTDPGHTTCADGSAGDAFLENGSGYATGALYAMWVYKFSLYDDVAIRGGARSLAQSVLRRICTTPTHSDPRVQALILELLGPG